MRKTLSEKLEAGRVRSGPYRSTKEYGPYGMFVIEGPHGRELRVMASAGEDDTPWEHVSVSVSTRTPNWPEMCFVKNLFWEPEETVMQLHPPQSLYVNQHPFCLHLWRPLKQAIPMPPIETVGTPRP